MIETGFFIIGLAWLVPNSSYPWLSFWMETVASTGLFLVATTILIKKKYISSNKYFNQFFVFILTCLLIDFIFRKNYHGDYFIGIYFILIFSTSVIVGLNLIEQSLKEIFSTAILIASILSALLAIAQFFEIPLSSAYFRERAFGSRTFANAGQPNHLATMLSFGVIALYSIRRKFSTPSFIAILSIIAFAAASSQSRTAILQFICIFLLLGFIYLKTRSPSLIIKSTIPLFFLFTYIYLIPKIKEFLQITSERNFIEIGVKSSRFDYWRSMLEAISNKPIFGYGWLRNVEAQLTATTNTTKEAVFQYSHNLFVDAFIWFGVPAGCIFIYLLIRVSFDALLVKNANERIYFIGFFAFLIHCMLEYPFAYLHLLIPAGIFLGISLQSSSKNITLHRPLTYFSTISTILISIAIFQDYKKNESIINELRFRYVNIGIFNEKPIVKNIIFLDQLDSWIKASSEKPIDANNSSTENYDNAALRYGTEKLLFHRYLAYTHEGNTKKSEESIKYICKIYSKATCEKYRSVH